MNKLINDIKHHLEKIDIKIWPDMIVPTQSFNNFYVSANLYVFEIADSKIIAQQIANLECKNFSLYSNGIDFPVEYKDGRVVLNIAVWNFPEGEKYMTEKTLKDINKSNKYSSNEFSKAFDILRFAINQDQEIAWAWHCNVAVPFQDEGGSHEASNKAAVKFMFNVFGVDTSKNEHYMY